ncbi:MAG: hypothetical protein H6566_29085 [Lewinellaceae bacterium]|nr:hypothetical protein [Lewinellaceae bacterium]
MNRSEFKNKKCFYGFIPKRLKKMFYLIFLLIMLAFVGVGIYGYLNGVMAPPYDPQKTTLNYERIGNGSKKIILLHGLTGSLNYWKRGLEEISDSYSLLLIDLLGFGGSPKPNSKYEAKKPSSGSLASSLFGMALLLIPGISSFVFSTRST